jgi:hypothetical protein
MLGLRAQSRQFLSAVLVCALVTRYSAFAMGQAAADPHWSKDACSTCHVGTVGPIAPASVTPLCVSCHNGVRASEEAHPVGRLMTPQMSDPGWPTVSGAVGCLTCHDVKQQCDPNADRPETNASFLRQAANATAPFCESCHRDEQVPKFNPHRMLEDDLQTPIQQKCQVCHEKTMDASTGVRSGDMALRADQVTLCKSCHPHHRDISPVGHVLARIQPGMLVYMRARELTGLLTTPGQDLIRQLAEQNATPQMMVPDSQGRVVCSTCHNPHEKGTFPSASVLDDRSLRLMKGHLITPVRGELFCRHCHNL